MSIASESPLRDALYGGAIDRQAHRDIEEAFSRRRTMLCDPAYAPASTLFDSFYSQPGLGQEEEKQWIESMFFSPA